MPQWPVRIFHRFRSILPLAGTCLAFSVLPLVADHALASAAPRGSAPTEAAISCDTFLDSLGINTHVDQGYVATAYVQPLQYLGIRNIRDGARNVASTLMLHQKAGVRVDLVAGSDVAGLANTARKLAAADALLALEGPSEPGNFPLGIEGARSGGTGDWIPVAHLQRRLYDTVKHDPVLGHYPVFQVSEAGAETDNAGLQFLTIPAGAQTSMPSGTRYADYANVHNYVIGNCHRYLDNQAWSAADPTLNSCWDSLYAEYGRAWKHRYTGYNNEQLSSLPRVTTETGWDSVSDPGGETVQGKVLVNTYLAQFARGWRYTFVYELRDNEGGAGHQGLYREDWTPKPSATYIHNLTVLLADTSHLSTTGRLDFSIPHCPATVHHLLLEKSDQTFELVIWGERVDGHSRVTIHFPTARPNIKVYDVTHGTEPIQVVSDVAEISLSLGDHALIIETR